VGTDCINLLAAAVKMADRVLTVSPNYANEIQSPEGGQGLHGLLQGKGAHLRLGGILNGISDEWNPKTDPHIAFNYSKTNFLEVKPKCKQDLQQKLGLQQDPNVALIGFCGRLCNQKGIHLILSIVDWLMKDQGNQVNGRVQIVMMGKGDLKFADELRQCEARFKGRICGYVGFDPRIEHQMMAGCDFFLMPSQYEPCGLPQMYAQAYGTIPIVHETGGLKDSVKGLWDEGRDRATATGFVFSGFDENQLKERVYQALEMYLKKKELFEQLQRNALSCNFYWPLAIDEYEKHIDWTMEAEPGRR
jgi:starch synthase